MRAIGDLIRSGKIRSFGLSNFRGWRIAEVVHLCKVLGVPQPVVCQPYYNLLNRQPEVEILPACAHYGLGVVPYSPLAREVLANPLISAVIVGPRTLAHLEAVYGALAITLDTEDEALVNALVVPGHASSAGYNDPQYPFFGRPVQAAPRACW